MSKWQLIKTAPRDGTKIDVWLHIYASPRSMGMADSFRLIECWFENGHWVHFDRGKVEALFDDYVTHWMPCPKPPRHRKGMEDD